VKRDKKIIPAATAASGCFRGTSIALLLLKGPSHKAIAAVRQTSQKTVRRQSLAVYRKAGEHARGGARPRGREEFVGFITSPAALLGRTPAGLLALAGTVARTLGGLGVNGQGGSTVATRTSVALIASFAASCAAMTRGPLFGSNEFYTPAQAHLVQRSLNEHGYPVELTGIYDQRTRAAVTGFQRSHGIETTGDMDPATAHALGLDPSEVTPTREEDWIQDQLQYDTWHSGDGVGRH
jgi:hypothetical protein